MNTQSTLNTVKDSMNDLQDKHEVNENTVRVIQEGIVSNTLAIKSNFDITKEHNLLIEKLLDMMAKQERDHNDLIEAKQDLLAKQEKEHNEIIEAKLDILAKREKETCSPPKPIVQPLVIEHKDDSNAVQKQQSSNAKMTTEAQLKPTMEDTPVSNILINSTPIANPITKAMGSEKT